MVKYNLPGVYGKYSAYLSEITSNDYEDLLRLYKQDKIFEYCVSATVDYNTVNKEFVKNDMENSRLALGLHIVSNEKDDQIIDNKLVGFYKLKKSISTLFDANFLVYGLDLEYEGLGLGINMLKTGTEVSFKEFDIRKIKATVAEHNSGSIRAVSKCGYFSLSGINLEETFNKTLNRFEAMYLFQAVAYKSKKNLDNEFKTKLNKIK